MKKMPDRLKVDRRKSRLSNLKDNGFSETMKENRSENSGLVKIKRRRIEILKEKIAETTDQAEIEKMKSEIEKKEQQIEKYLNKNTK
ncbi:hypothetical protein WKW47_03520 [Staphylococcus nepalensis]|uniref:hypothetical protein n=1 Tax=Staphylococcus nepalensis TaxID=214473 RepID=UPI003F493F26